jgi:hypothetical protein
MTMISVSWLPLDRMLTRHVMNKDTKEGFLYMFGFPLHFSLTSVSDILEEVKATDIHRCQHPEVEFSAAVRVFPYASNIFSVWIFLCSLVPEYK